MDARQRWIRRKGESLILEKFALSAGLTVESFVYTPTSGLTVTMALKAIADYESAATKIFPLDASDATICHGVAEIMRKLRFNEFCYAAISVDFGGYNPPWVSVRSERGMSAFGRIWKLTTDRECLLMNEEQTIVVGCFEEEYGHELHVARFRDCHLEYRFLEKDLS